MRIFNNSRYCHTIYLKFEDLFFFSLAKLVLEAKASICSTIKENLLLYCQKLLVFGPVSCDVWDSHKDSFERKPPLKFRF